VIFATIYDFIFQFHEEGGNILVCTPGRLEDILMGKTLGHKEIGVANGLKALVSPEAHY
jgi:superfamily II DNA/RNA helicase